MITPTGNVVFTVHFLQVASTIILNGMKAIKMLVFDLKHMIFLELLPIILYNSSPVVVIISREISVYIASNILLYQFSVVGIIFSSDISQMKI